VANALEIGAWSWRDDRRRGAGERHL